MGHAFQALGEVRRRLGRRQEARSLVERGLGELDRQMGRLDRAAACLRNAERIYDELRVPLPRTRTLRSLGTVLALAGDAAAAAASRPLAGMLIEELGLVEPIGEV